MSRRISVTAWALGSLLLISISGARAQVKLTDNTPVTMNGSVTVGYNASTGNLTQSSHDLILGVNGELRGYYYDPNFLSFSVVPIYGRQQDNQESTTTTNQESYLTIARIFSGSRFPGQISFGQGWSNSGSFGVAGSSGLVSNYSTRDFGVSWSELIPDMPSLTVSYNRSTDTNELVGTSNPADSHGQIFSVGSDYNLLGFKLDGRYMRSTNEASTPELFQDNSIFDTQNVANNYQVTANHKFPMDGTFNVSYGHNTFSSESAQDISTGSNDNASAFLNFAVLRRLPVAVSADYNSNVTALVDQQLIGTGAFVTPQQWNFGGRQLLLNFSTRYTQPIFRRIVATGYVVHTESLLNGDPYGFTQFGGSLAYNFNKFIKGLTITAGLYDLASRQGNLGASIVGQVSYERQFGRWDLTGHFGHDQSVETLGLFRTVSSFNYNGTARRRLGHQLRLFVGGGGGHSGFGQTEGTGSHSEFANAGITWRRYSLTTSYTQSHGASLMTLNGLVPVPAPLNGPIPNSQFILYNARSYGANLALAPTRKIVVTGVYRKFNSDLNSFLLNTGTVSQLLGFRIGYRVRRLSFDAGSNTTRQTLNTNTPGLPQTVTSYYFGISRWFNVF